MKKASENNYIATGFPFSSSKRGKHIYTKVYIYILIFILRDMGRGAIWEETFDTEPLDLKGTKKWATPTPFLNDNGKKEIIHLCIELDKVVTVSEK